MIDITHRRYQAKKPAPSCALPLSNPCQILPEVVISSIAILVLIMFYGVEKILCTKIMSFWDDFEHKTNSSLSSLIIKYKYALQETHNEHDRMDKFFSS